MSLLCCSSNKGLNIKSDKFAKAILQQQGVNFFVYIKVLELNAYYFNWKISCNGENI